MIIVTLFELQIQNEGYLLQSGVKDALVNALLLAVKRFSSGHPQVHCFSFFLLWLCRNIETFLVVLKMDLCLKQFRLDWLFVVVTTAFNTDLSCTLGTHTSSSCTWKPN